MKIPIQSLEVEGVQPGHPYKKYHAPGTPGRHFTSDLGHAGDIGPYIKNAGDLFILGDVVLVLRCVLS